MGMTIDNLYKYSGHPTYIATKEFQRRKHRKKRINKKWLKRYGTYEMNMLPHNEVIMMDDKKNLRGYKNKYWRGRRC